MKELLKEKEEEIKKLRKENRKLKDELTVVHRYENIELEVAWKRIEELEEENRKLKEERDFFKEQAILWRNDYKNEYEENRKLKSEIRRITNQRENLKGIVDNLIDENRYLEECLDNKEKVNKQLREDIGKLVMNNPS